MNKKLKLSIVISLLSIGLVAAILHGSSGSTRKKADDKLSSLRTFNKTVLLVKEKYVDPSRIVPKEMLISVLDALEKNVAEVVVFPEESSTVVIQVGTQKKKLSIANMSALWDLSFRLRDALKFIEKNLPLNSKVDKKQLEYIAVNGMLAKLDPHSILLEPKYSREVKMSTRGQFGGLGIVISVKDGYLTVISPIEDAPAEKAGVKALDQIVKIGEESTINMPLDEAVSKLRGAPGSLVKITVRRGKNNSRGSLIDIPITRAIIKVDSVTSHLIEPDKNQKNKKSVGYIKIKAFQGNTQSDVAAALNKFKAQTAGKLGGVILDFRNNPGGLLDQSVLVSDLFLDGGTVVVTKSGAAQNRGEEKARPGKDKEKLPVVVLVNNGSASASEIVAGAIKNRGRGIVVGQETFGKGSVQMLFDFPDKSALKLTIAEYLTPGDISIQNVGITPDIKLRPIYLKDQFQTDIFENAKMSEKNLDAHLVSDSTRDARPAYEFSYLSKPRSQEEMQSRAVSKKFKNDYEIDFAAELLRESQTGTRQDLLKTAEKLVKKSKGREIENIGAELKKYKINWALNQKNLNRNPSLKFKLINKPVVRAGEKIKITVEAQNTGKKDLQRVYAVSDSATPLFKGWEFLFGKLKAGEKKQWTAEYEIPKSVASRKDLMRLTFNSAGKKVIGELNIPIKIKGQKRPVLGFSYDISSQTLTPDKLINLNLKIKNTGKGLAHKPVVLLKNKTGPEVFIEKGRMVLEDLKPGQEAMAKLAFKLLKDDASQTVKDKIELEINLYDATMGEFWTENITLPTKKSIEAVSYTPPTIQFLNIPESLSVKSSKFKLKALIDDNVPVSDAFIFLNDQKIYFESFKNKNKKQVNLQQNLQLDPGVNTITIVARENGSFAHRASATIFSESGDPIMTAKK